MENLSLDEMFRTRKVLNASDEELEQMLMQLCDGHIENWMVIHREVIRGITINHLQIKRYIKKLNKQNTVLQIIIIVLTFIMLFTAGYQIYTTEKYGRNLILHTEQQVSPKSEVAKSKMTQVEKTREHQSKTSSNIHKDDVRTK